MGNSSRFPKIKLKRSKEICCSINPDLLQIRMLEINKIYNQDCLEGMKLLDDHSIDLICTDLPYGVTQNKSDIVIPFEPLWEQYERIIKENGAIVLFGQGMFYIDLVDSNRKLFRYDLVWDKILTTGFLNAKKMPLRQHEQIAVFYKKPPTYNPQFTVGKPLHSQGKACVGNEVVNNNYGKFDRNNNDRAGSSEKYPTSIIRIQKPHPSIAKHRTAKPVELIEWIIKTYTNPDEIVLDSCAGSGTTAIAAMNTGRNWICFENDKNIYEAAEDRIKDCQL